ncbi:MAG: hypothetical protein A2017_06200 [Lentisphaerae bacterium GWF2_44_16]|nr:MAG: hypothetical protein A2017_06200 [Lentisphaerae bacterium GWF2_44_16]
MVQPYMDYSINYERFKMKENPVPALQRGCEIISLIAMNPGINISGIEKNMEIPKASLNRIIKVLLEKDFIAHTEEKRGLKIGKKLLSDVMKSYEVDPLVKNTAVMLRNLGEKWKTTFVVYQYEEAFKVVWKAKYEPVDGIKTQAPGSFTQKMHISAQGQLFFSLLPDLKIKEFVSSEFAEKITEKTLTTEAELLKRIREIRKQKWAYQEKENSISRKQIAIPLVFNNIPGLYALGCHLPLEFNDIEKLKTDMLIEASKFSYKE